ncbi:MAG: RNA polymerase sigma-70 factor [Bacteroidales bacterium]|nr:RNA polymerase sigma-70 factor [Bacteroidales bacterium]
MNEKLLIDGLKRRDKIVFDYIFNYYYSGLCAFCMQFLDDKDAVEDLVQDFFVHLWVKGKDLQINISIKSYLFTSVKNRCLDRIKHRKVSEKYRKSILFGSSDSELSVDLYFAEAELRHAILTAMEKLPPRSREIFEISRLKGLTNQEISDKLGISKRTVELQISNALKVLRAELAEFMPLWLILWLLK